MIGGTGGNDKILKILGFPLEKPDEELSPRALQLRKLRRSIPLDFFEPRRPSVALDGQLEVLEEDD